MVPPHSHEWHLQAQILAQYAKTEEQPATIKAVVVHVLFDLPCNLTSDNACKKALQYQLKLHTTHFSHRLMSSLCSTCLDQQQTCVYAQLSQHMLNNLNFQRLYGLASSVLPFLCVYLVVGKKDSRPCDELSTKEAQDTAC